MKDILSIIKLAAALLAAAFFSACGNGDVTETTAPSTTVYRCCC